MTTDFRALCAELLDKVVARPLILDRELIARARAALADEPAVPEGREPVSVTGQPSDQQLLEVMPQQFHDDLAAVSRMAAHGAGPDVGPGLFRVSLNTGVVDFARAVLARFGHHFPDATKMVSDAYQMGRRDASADSQQAAEAAEPTVPTVMEIIELSYEIEAAGLGQVDLVRAALTRWGNPAPQPPGDGEVAELVVELRMMASQAAAACQFTDAENLSRAADLLERQAAPVPVPVSERWPEFSDCDDTDRVWCWNWAVGAWRLNRINRSIHTHWLPAHALPLPGQEAE